MIILSLIYNIFLATHTCTYILTHFTHYTHTHSHTSHYTQTHAHIHAHIHTLHTLHTHTHYTHSLYAVEGSGWVVIHVDFKNIFDGKCESDDYYDWTPYDEVTQ